MKKVPFRKAVFVTSALKTDELPASDLPEIAIVGRSNVGKSSLINHLLRTKSVAKISGTPGKTERINYFLIDDSLLLVDLPGYGYAKKGKKVKEEWGVWIDKYLRERPLKLVLFLLDSRRSLSSDDQEFIAWACHQEMPLFLVITKTDKLSQKETLAAIKKIESEKTLSGLPYLMYSVKEGKCREILIHEINNALWD